MLRQTITDSLKAAMKGKDEAGTSCFRMILAGLKERDIEARAKGNTQGIGEAEIMSMLQNMIKQRRDSVELYDKGGRADLAAKETAEIAIIQKLLPQQLDEAGTARVVQELIAELGATSIKDMGRVMAALRERHAGKIDMAKAGAAVKQALASS
ncbi:MAG: GatB/YqeY domain-containing protein [Alphaproteobacteria bacterium]|nr:GatB/YqeY domain-containing protein [Alphaproteobacteria bacterium]